MIRLLLEGVCDLARYAILVGLAVVVDTVARAEVPGWREVTFALVWGVVALPLLAFLPTFSGYPEKDPRPPLLPGVGSHWAGLSVLVGTGLVALAILLGMWRGFVYSATHITSG